jgi:hypothetical protein
VALEEVQVILGLVVLVAVMVQEAEGYTVLVVEEQKTILRKEEAMVLTE